MSAPPELTNKDDLRDKRRAAWAGVALNAPLAAGKILVGLAAQSQALVADGVHSLSDLASDAAVIWALGHSHRPPDTEHPFGHGRFETLATLAIAAMLALAAIGILIDAGLRLIDPPTTAPAVWALWVAGLSIALKEALYHYTKAVARRTGSAMMAANAWHHRSDAASSVVALAGIGAAMLGWPLADALGAAIIALMLGRVAWVYGRPAVRELADTAPPADMSRAILSALTATPGLRDAHDLRLRHMGGAVQADVHVALDPAMTLSEAHRLCEAARATVLAQVPEVTEIIIHPEPDGHADGRAAHDAALRPELQAQVRDCLEGIVPAGAIRHLRLDYRDEGVIAVVELSETPIDGAQTRVAFRLRQHTGDLAEIRLLWAPAI
ncbi:cation diffusion facilitator family transporter [Roseinatronobacter monicus]|uniref:Cation diffusion facilitator family transporter n=1 Tax=Roseinatronobacter monicus TaxID=393481 RepID=A0A543KFQ8_9RHOB|nr:cation diffusion facilitator family transporter [Roseinatronobacter monicus]TQM93857.1 cation diffusion facilitator family transporter [Roseinatronobacter monicus]